MNSKIENITREEIKHPNFPSIIRYKNVFTPEECQQIIEHGRPSLHRSITGVPNSRPSDSRTSSQAWMRPRELPCMQRIADFVSKETKLPTGNQEEWQLLHYKVGQEFQEHYDACNPFMTEREDCLSAEENRGWGARVYTFFIYLNDVPEGGETCFPKLGVKFEPEQGTAILWKNLTIDNLGTHIYSMHSGAPVTKGEKWAINVWVRERPQKALFDWQLRVPQKDGYDIV